MLHNFWYLIHYAKLTVHVNKNKYVRIYTLRSELYDIYILPLQYNMGVYNKKSY